MIYFVRKASDPRSVKIGKSADIERRMKSIAVAGPIILFAKCEGDSVEERYFLKKFAHLRTEGEWFAADDAMLRYISENAEACYVEYGKSEVRWSFKKPDNRRELDGLVAHLLIKRVINEYPRSVTVAKAHEDIYLALSKIGEGWTRRRVRALYEQTAHRVDLFEIIDLLKLSKLPEPEWIPWLRGDHHNQFLEAAE